MGYTIELASRGMACNAQPIEGQWYVGVNDRGEFGAVAKYVNGEFINSAGVINMTTYQYLVARTIAAEVAHEEADDIALLDDPQAKVRLALRWLETLTKNRCLMWAPDQKEACLKALADAKAAL